MEIKIMKKLVIVLSHLKENKAFYVILALNCIISFCSIYFIENYDPTKHRFEIREDMNNDHKVLDSLCIDIHFKSNKYLSRPSVHESKQITFHNILGRLFYNCIDLKIHTKMTCNSILSLLLRQMVTEF